MSIQQGMTWPLRIIVLVVGALVVLGGFAARDFEENAALGRIPGGEEGMLEDGTWVRWEVVGDQAVYETEEIGDGLMAVFMIVPDGDTRQEVFRGNPDAAHAYVIGETRVVVFEGTKAELDAWVEAEYDKVVDMTAADAAIGIGVLLIATSLVIGRRPTAPAPDQPRVLLPH